MRSNLLIIPCSIIAVCPMTSRSRRRSTQLPIPPWAIALILIFLLILLSALAFLLLKLLLMLLVSTYPSHLIIMYRDVYVCMTSTSPKGLALNLQDRIEVRKFEEELGKSNYPKVCYINKLIYLYLRTSIHNY